MMKFERSFCILPSELGWMGMVIVSDDSAAWVERLAFGYAKPSEVTAVLRAADDSLPITDHKDRWTASWVRALQAYSAGKKEDLRAIPLRTAGFTSFELAVRRACQTIPRGEIRTYGELAHAVGHPGAARAVGNVMRKNPTPLLVPCHRVVGRQGLGNFSAPQGVVMKRRLLEMEAAASGDSGRAAATSSDAWLAANV